MEKWLGSEIPKLGFGMMRMPTLADGNVDLSQVNEMVDRFMQGGFTYIDTAYGYHNGQSEVITRKAVVERFPRDSFVLATKLPLWHVKEKDDMQRLFDTQLERTGVDYFDYYLMHAYHKGYRETLDRVDAWSFMRGLKAAGRARHIGLSFHDSAEVLDELLASHPELEFVQLQINYADWDSPTVQSRLCYEVAMKHQKPVIIMEPVKGGALAALTPEARAVLETARPDASVASWAMRYCASLPHVVTVLSGMSSLEQMEDNVGTMQALKPLTEADSVAIASVLKILASTPTTPCTDCRYCIENDGCPQDIQIPRIIAADNHRRLYNVLNMGQYNEATAKHGKASSCIQCGACEGRCPQQLPIIELMAQCAAVYEADANA